jgi:phage-related protein
VAPHAGKDVIHGLIDGITNAAGALWDKVGSIANGIKDKFASVLSIFSPSRVMRDEVGKMIPLGIAEGMQAGSGAIYNVAANMVPTGPAAYGIGASRPASVSGAGVTIQLNLQSGFIGSPDQLATALSDVIQRAKGRGLNLSFA